jgi:hypothetical protein
MCCAPGLVIRPTVVLARVVAKVRFEAPPALLKLASIRVCHLPTVGTCLRYLLLLLDIILGTPEAVGVHARAHS